MTTLTMKDLDRAGLLYGKIAALEEMAARGGLRFGVKEWIRLVALEFEKVRGGLK